MNTIYKLSLIGLLTCGFASCDSFLDREPFTQVTNENYFSSETNANAAATGMYRTMTSSYAFGQSVVVLPELSATHIKHASDYAEYENYRTHELTATNPWVENVWTAVYTTINAANNIIERVPEMATNTISDEKRQQFIGEAKFVRALNYFFLVRAFGPVPLKLTATTEGENLAIPQSTVADIYTQLVKDLTESVAALPESLETTEATKGRATKGAAQALLAKVYLYQASLTGDYTLAANTAKALIDEGNFELTANYASIWQTENSSESIFELQFDDQVTNPLAAVANDNASVLFYAKDASIVNLFEEKDKRRDFSVQVVTKTDKETGEKKTFYFMGKFPNASPASQNMTILRLPEILLIYAEAQARVSKAVTDEAFNSLNKVLTRAGVSKKKTDFASVDAFIQFVQEEKERELLFEGETWFDFCRTKLAVKKYSGLTEQQFLYPIPTSQISLNPDLKQNPGY